MMSNILAPGAVLVLWSMIMLFWMLFTRFAGFKAAKIDLKNAPAGGRGRDLNGVLPDKIMWKAHNYDHLMEQPTIFYPVIIILHLIGAASALAIGLAWGYVILRIIHSIWQSTVNVVAIRAPIFALSSFCLLGLALIAVRATLGWVG